MENIVANDEKNMSISPAKMLPPRNENGRDGDEEMRNEQQQQMMVDIEDEDDDEDEEEFGAGSTPKYLTRHFIKNISPLDLANKVAEFATNNAPPIETKDAINVRGAMAPKKTTQTVEGNSMIKMQKKRGRKKKIITDNTNNDQPIRRKRGRPRKVHIDNNNTTSSYQSESNSSSKEQLKKTMKMSNNKMQQQQTLQNQTAMKPTTMMPTANVNQNNSINKNLFPSRNKSVVGHYWAEFPITMQNSSNTGPPTISSNAEKMEEDEEPNKLPKMPSKKELDAIRFAGINPLIVLCEAATQQQEQANNLIGHTQLQNGHDYGNQQELRISSNSSTTSTSSSSSKTTTMIANYNKRRLNCTPKDSWGNEEDNLFVLGGEIVGFAATSSSKSPPPPSSHHHLQIFDPAPPSIIEEAADQRQAIYPHQPTTSVLRHPANSSDKQGGSCRSRAVSNNDNDKSYQYRIRLMSSIEARDHLTIVCLNAICNGEKLAKMRVLNKKKEKDNDEENVVDNDEDDVPFDFSLPKACLNMLTPTAIESLIEIVYEWVNHHWIRTIDGRLGAELRQFSRIDQMRWILVFAIPQLCIYYLKKARKISVDEAKQQFLAMESTKTNKFN